MEPSGVEAYRLGREYRVMPIPIDWNHTVEIAAGPVAFVVEARALTRDAIVDNERAQGITDGLEHDYADLDDSGASLHVLGADDRLEYLRFDCFDHEPHYHYVDQAAQSNTVVRFDDVAEGDPLEWTVRVVGSRLAEMVAHVGNTHLAEAVRARPDEVAAGVAELRATLTRAAAEVASVRGDGGAR